MGAKDGYYLTDGLPVACPNGTTINGKPACFACATPANCIKNNTNVSCIGGNLVCAEAKGGYYVKDGVATACAAQTGCATHDASAACIGANKDKKTCTKNSKDYSLKDGVVTKCSSGTTIEAGGSGDCKATSGPPPAPPR